MKDRAISQLSLFVALLSLVISAVLGYDSLNSSRESMSIEQLGLGDISLNLELELSQRIIVSNHSTRTVSVADSSCSVFSTVKDAGQFGSSCWFLDHQQLPVTIEPGAARAFEVRVPFPASDKLLWAIGQWKKRYPEEDAMCFLIYVLNEYGRDFAGNKYISDLPELPEPGKPPNFVEGSRCGSDATTLGGSWSVMRARDVASLLAHADNEEVYFQSFRVELISTRGNRFSSDQMFGSFGFPGGF